MARKTPIKEQNPFISGLLYPTKWLLNTQRGFDSFVIDIEPHVKIYDKLSSLLPNMTTGELQLLHSIIRKFPATKTDEGLQQDYLEINHKMADMSESTFHRAKNGLIEMNVIAKRVRRQGTYWINPAMMFRGNRVKSYPENGAPVNDDPLHDLKERSKTVIFIEDES
jgi:hypothetical protein